jgi:hypothetical protein
MIQHVVMFRWKDEFTAAQRHEWLDAVRRLPQQIEVLRALRAGPDVLGLDRSWDAALVADFDRVEDVATYVEHPAHLPLIAVSGAGAEQIVSVDFVV